MASRRLALIKTSIHPSDDRITDPAINAENIAYKFTFDLYSNAERYKDRVAGADTIIDELDDLFKGQGNHNDTPENP